MLIESEKIIIKQLSSYLEGYHSVSIIGIAKNAGKTTVLNTLIEELKHTPIAITSIGLDGEEIDQLTNQQKPRIKGYDGMIFATAKSCLNHTTASYVIHEDTKIRTALGNVVIIEITVEGLVLVAGPSTKQQMIEVKEKLNKYNPSKILIDGALFRKSIATKALVDGVIFVTGASYSNDINKVVKDTKNIIDQYAYKTTDVPEKILVKNYENSILILENNIVVHSIIGNIIGSEEKIVEHLNSKTTHMYFPRSLNEKMANAILHKRSNIEEVELIIHDSSYLLIKPETIEKLSKIGVKICVLNPIDILFVAYNPTSPFSYDFDNNEFSAKLSAALGKKPINVLQDLR